MSDNSNIQRCCDFVSTVHAYAGFIHVVLPFLFIFHCALIIVSAILKKKINEVFR